jgi:hypothetical protein
VAGGGVDVHDVEAYVAESHDAHLDAPLVDECGFDVCGRACRRSFGSASTRRSERGHVRQASVTPLISSSTLTWARLTVDLS